ncbi:MAG: DUF6644 family protein [Vicinamibacterales bacterium]
MDAVWTWLESLPLAMHVGETWWFPLLESIHVVAATFLVGSIAMLDFRLIGRGTIDQRVSRLSRDIVPWTLAAAVVAVATGLPLFSTRATHYAHNTAFQIKVGLLVLAGLNMLWFHFRTSATMTAWDAEARPIRAARLAGVGSLLLWAGIMLSGRWVGHLL